MLLPRNSVALSSVITAGSFAACFIHGSNCLAAPGFDGQPPGEPQKVYQRVSGKVKAVDPEAKTLTLSLPGGAGDRVFKLSTETKYTRDGQPAQIADVVAGKIAECTVVSVHVKSVPGGEEHLDAVNLKENTAGR